MTPEEVDFGPKPRNVRMRKAKARGQFFMMLFMIPFVLASLGMTSAVGIFAATDMFGSTTQGTVSRHDFASGGDGTEYNLYCTYTIGTEQHTRRISVTQDEYRRLKDGSKIDVRYLPVLPAITSELPQIEGTSPPNWILAAFTLVWDALVTAFCWAMFVVPELQRNILRNGAAATATILDKSLHTSTEDTVYKLKYRFNFPSGRDFVCEVAVTQNEYHKADIGDSLIVFYNEQNPEVCVPIKYSNFEFSHSKHGRN
jgi:hypothetical protein